MTPTLSVEALHVSVKAVCVTDEEARPEGTDGACVSAGGGPVMQKSSRKRVPAAPLFQVQILALTAPAGTAWVTERSAYAVLVTCRLISLSSVPDEFRKSTPTPAHEGPPATLAQNWKVRDCPALTGITPERLRPPSDGPTRAAFAPE